MADYGSTYLIPGTTYSAYPTAGAQRDAVNMIGTAAGVLRPQGGYTAPAPQQSGSTGPGNLTGGGGGGGYAQPSAQDLAFLSDQEAQLRSLLGRTDTGLNQGLTKNNDQYNEQVGRSTTDKNNQVGDQNKARLDAYGTINRNARAGLNSLRSIVGRAGGTGSSAYKELLPNIVGKDTSSKRFSATENYDTNLSKIDTSFQDVLGNLLKQKKDNEESLRSGIETQRQDINSKLAQNAAQRAQALGGGYEAVKAAQAPYQQAIENSRNQVENFFNQFRTQYVAPELKADVNPYETDRAAVNAGQSGADSTNPYGQLLRKKLQGQA